MVKKVLSIVALLSILALAVGFVYVLAQPSYQTKYRLYDDIYVTVEAYPNESLDNLSVVIVNKAYQIATVEIIDVYVNDMPHDARQEMIYEWVGYRGTSNINLENVDYFGNTKIEFKLNINHMILDSYETKPMVVEINVLNIIIKNLQYWHHYIYEVISQNLEAFIGWRPEHYLIVGGIAGIIIIFAVLIIGVIIRSKKQYQKNYT